MEQFVWKYSMMGVMLATLGNCFPDRPESIFSEPARIVILGNSITQHNPSPPIGWTGNWGMAASAPERDYIHLLKHDLESGDPKKANLSYANIAQAFEERFWNYDSVAIEKVAIHNPDILVFRLGDNMNADSVQKYSVNKAFRKLVEQIAPAGKTRVLLTSCFWQKAVVNDALKRCATTNGWEYVDMSLLVRDSTNTAVGQFENKGVANHPSDKGMMQIYNLLSPRLASALEQIEKR